MWYCSCPCLVWVRIMRALACCTRTHRCPRDCRKSFKPGASCINCSQVTTLGPRRGQAQRTAVLARGRGLTIASAHAVNIPAVTAVSAVQLRSPLRNPGKATERLTAAVLKATGDVRSNQRSKRYQPRTSVQVSLGGWLGRWPLRNACVAHIITCVPPWKEVLETFRD